jgi:hypothetical protein
MKNIVDRALGVFIAEWKFDRAFIEDEQVFDRAPFWSRLTKRIILLISGEVRGVKKLIQLSPIENLLRGMLPTEIQNPNIVPV